MLKAKQPLNVVVEKGKELKISTKINVDKSKKNIKQGEVVGDVAVLIDGKEVGRVEVYSDRDIKINGLFDKLSGIFKKDDQEQNVENK